MALDKFNPYLFVSAGEQSNKFLTPTYADGIAQFQAQRAQELTGLTVRIDPIQSGSGDPSPSNIRPISGRTGLTVTRAGRNLLPQPSPKESHTTNGITFTYNDDGTITANGTATGAAMSRAVSFRLPFGNYRKSGRTLVQYKEATWRTVTGGGPTSNLMTIDEDIELACRINIASGTTLDNVTYYPYIYAESDTYTGYEPYTAQEYPISWQTQAGAIYGGTLDVVSGVLTVTAEYIQLTADMWTAWNNTDKAAFTNAEYSGRTVTMCDSLAPNSTGIYVRQADGRIRAVAPWAASCTSLEKFKTALANNPPINVVISLATPSTYQLTPTDVKTLAGFNQIYSDAGPVIDIKF